MCLSFLFSSLQVPISEYRTYQWKRKSTVVFACQSLCWSCEIYGATLTMQTAVQGLPVGGVYSVRIEQKCEKTGFHGVEEGRNVRCVKVTLFNSTLYAFCKFSTFRGWSPHWQPKTWVKHWTWLKTSYQFELLSFKNLMLNFSKRSVCVMCILVTLFDVSI